MEKLRNFPKSTVFIMAVLLQIAVVLGMIGFKSLVISSGQEIALQIEPVDPRDPLRGDYVTIRYSDLSSIPAYQFSYPDIQNGDEVFVPLSRNGISPIWRATYGVSKSRPQSTSSSGAVYLKGRVVSGGGSNTTYDNFGFPRTPNSSSRIQVTYGIEDYFIPEGTGRSFQMGSDKTSNFAVVSVNEDGNAVLRRIYLDNKQWPK